MAKIVLQMPQGRVPPNYVQVCRWVDANEVEIWKRGCSHIPVDIGRGTQVYVALPGSTKPQSSTGEFRIDFWVPKEMLKPGSKPEWKQIFGPVANSPIYNVTITDFA